MKRTYEELAHLPRPDLDATFAAGTPPRIEELAGWEFSGWNCSLLPKLGGFQKFVKGFYRPAEAPSGEGEGFNIVVIQNGLDGEWLGLPADDTPKRHGFYRVRSALPGETSGARAGGLLLDYGVHERNSRFEASRLLRDVLVKVDGDPDLLLGKAHLALGRWIFGGYFLLTRHRQHDFRG